MTAIASAKSSAPRRLFFALWPPAQVRAALVREADAAGIRGRHVAPARLHLTLAFLGDVDIGAIPALQAKAADVASSTPQINLALYRLGWFARPRIAWAAPLTAPPALATLAVRLVEAGAAIGTRRPARAFRPHVTLARASEAPQRRRTAQVIDWPVAGFSLTASAHGQYRDLARWRLSG